MTTAADPQIVPPQPASLPALRAADQGVADALESVLSENTRRVYGAQWRLFTDWCSEMGLRSLPAEPLTTVARYLAVRAGDGAAVATLRLATIAIARAHEWAGHESPCKDRGVRVSLKGWGRRLAKPQRQACALTAAVLAVIRLTAVQPRKRGPGFETAEQAAERATFDVALVAVLDVCPRAHGLVGRYGHDGAHSLVRSIFIHRGSNSAKIRFPRDFHVNHLLHLLK